MQKRLLSIFQGTLIRDYYRSPAGYMSVVVLTDCFKVLAAASLAASVSIIAIKCTNEARGLHCHCISLDRKLALPSCYSTIC